MKLKITLFIAILCGSFSNAQQTKLGTVNSDYIVGKMPQTKSVLKRIERSAKKLDSSFQVKTKDYQAKIEAYKAAEKTLSDADKKTKYQEIISLEQDMQKFRVNGSKVLQLRQNESMRPIYKKLGEVIEQVAKENGYTQVLTTNGNQFGYIDERFDITKLVLAKLGIKE